MHEFRSQRAFGAAYVAALAGQMLFGEVKALRTYQVVWLMAKGGGKGGGKGSTGTSSGRGGDGKGGGNPFSDFGGNWPSKTGRRSGKGRGNNPPGGGS